MPVAGTLSRFVGECRVGENIQNHWAKPTLEGDRPVGGGYQESEDPDQDSCSDCTGSQQWSYLVGSERKHGTAGDNGILT